MKIIPFFSNRLKPQLVTLNADGNLGIDSIKTVLTVVVTFAVDIIAALKDRNYFALISLLPRLLAQGNIIALAKMAWTEIKDTSLEESNDIHKHFTEVLDLKDDEAEELIEYAFGLVPRVYQFAVDALTFTGDIQAFYQEVRERFGAKNNTEKLAAKANTNKLLLAA